jgi:RNA polymerase sigma-70 factor, ECF subfamily
VTDERTNEQWLRDLRGEPSPRALADLRERLTRGLRYALKQRYHITEPDIEDFVQDSLVKILDNLDTFRGESQFLTWAQKIAVREAFSELRRKRWENISLQDLVPAKIGNDSQDVSPFGWIPSDQITPEQDVTQQSLRALLAQMIQEELTDLQRQALIAIAIHGMPLEEVARRMHTNRNALYKLLHDARKRLKQRLEAQGVTMEEFMATFAADK